MEGGSATWSLLSGASCKQTARSLFGWSAQPFFMFWMSPGSFLPPSAAMIWMSPARVMFLKHEVQPLELIIVIQLTTSLRRWRLCRCSTQQVRSRLTNSCCLTDLCLRSLIIWKRNHIFLNNLQLIGLAICCCLFDVQDFFFSLIIYYLWAYFLWQRGKLWPPLPL